MYAPGLHSTSLQHVLHNPWGSYKLNLLLDPAGEQVRISHWGGLSRWLGEWPFKC